jgi:hypothetical protein
LKPEQLYALTEFSKKLETLFPTYDEAYRLYYERRDGQYDRFPAIEKTRIVGPQALIRVFASMFLNEPTRATRTYRAIRDMVGTKIFREGDRVEPYYVAAYAAYRLEFLFRNKRLAGEYRAARYHILMVLRYLINATKLPPMHTNKMEKRCAEMLAVLWDDGKVDTLMAQAAAIVKEVVGDPFDRDNIRTEPVKDALVGRFVRKPTDEQ